MGSHLPSGGSLKGLDIDLSWGNPGQEYSSPYHRPDPVPQGDTVYYPVVEGMK